LFFAGHIIIQHIKIDTSLLIQQNTSVVMAGSKSTHREAVYTVS